MFGGRTRRRGSSAAGSYLYYFTIGILIIAATLVLAVSIVPSLSFSSVALDRSGTVGTAGDGNAVVGLNVASSVTEGSTDRLVTVTNNLDDSAQITVSLNNGGQGTLYYGSSSVGSTHTVTLDPGESASFDIHGSFSNGGSDGSTSDCSEAQTTAEQYGWDVSFYCAYYDSSQDETTYKYGVEPVDPPGQMHDLSHIVFGFEDGFDPVIVSSSPEADEDGVKTHRVTGVYGLKFDGEIDKTGSGQIYTFTVDGHYGTGPADHGLHAGTDTFNVSLPGPSSSSGPGTSAGGEETITFTVSLDSEELSGTLVRSTSLEPESTPTEAPTATEGEDDDEQDDEDDEDDDDGDGGPPQENPGGGNDGDDDDEEDDE